MNTLAFDEFDPLHRRNQGVGVEGGLWDGIAAFLPLWKDRIELRTTLPALRTPLPLILKTVQLTR